jgi:hypothetical protein
MEPKRWLNEHQSPEVRLALRAGVAVAPPPELQRECWTALGAALAAGGAAAISTSVVLGSASAAVKPSALGAGALLKLFGIGASVGVLVAGGAAAVSRFGATEPATARPALGVPASAVEPAADERPARPVEPDSALTARAPVGRAEPTPAVATPPAATEPRAAEVPAPSLSPSIASSEESTLVLSAREALRAKDPEEALRMLDRARQSFGRGRLAEERLALEIDALLAAGRAPQAKRAALTFLERYPQSPHAARFRALP